MTIDIGWEAGINSNLSITDITYARVYANLKTFHRAKSIIVLN